MSPSGQVCPLGQATCSSLRLLLALGAFTSLLWLSLSPSPLSAQSAGDLSVGEPIEAPALTWAVPEPTSKQVRVGIPFELTFYLLSAEASALAGQRPEVLVEGGRIIDLEEDVPGVYQLSIEPTGGLLQVQIPTDNGLQTLLSVQALPEELPEVSITFGADVLHLSRSDSLEFTIDANLPGFPEPSLPDLKIVTNIGQVEDLESLGEGRFKGRYVAPPRKRPQVALLGVSMGGGETFRWGAATLPLIGRTTLETQTAPGATVYGKVEDVTYGPFMADSSGAVRVVVEVPPGVKGVDLMSKNQGGTSTTTSPLGLPPYPRGLILLGQGMALDPQGEQHLGTALTPLRREFAIIAVGPRGQDLTPAVEELSLGVGTLLHAQSPRPGALRGQVELLPHHAPLNLQFTPSDSDDVQAILGSIEAEVGRPQRLRLQVNPRTLRVDDPPAQLEIQTFDAAGLPARGGQIVLEATEGRVGSPKELGPGERVAAYEPPRSLEGAGSAGAMTVDIRAKLFWDPGVGPPATIDVVPGKKMVSPQRDQGGVPIYVRILDRAGLPVVNIPLNGRVLEGEGVLTGGETDPGGWATLTYVPPREGKVGPIQIRVLVEGYPRLYRDVLLILSLGPHLPLGDDGKRVVPGSPDLISEAQVRVEAGRVRQVRISVEPNTLYVGGISQGQVRVRLLDSQGNAIVDPEMEIVAEAGKVGPISLDPDGTHTARFSPPQGAEPGRVEVQVSGKSEPYFGATEVSLAPRQSDLLLSSRGGTITNLAPQGFFVPMGSLTLMAQLPRTDRPLYGMGGISFHRISRSFDRTEIVNGVEVENYIRSLQTSVLAFYLGGAYRARLGRMIAQGSLSFVGGAVPYATDYWDDSEGYLWQIDGSVGVRAGLGVELGVGPGGVAFEFAFTQLALDADGGESGNIGGITLELGYVIPLR